MNDFWLHPALPLLAGALLLPLIPRLLLKPYLLLMPLLAFLRVISLQPGIYGQCVISDWVLIFGRVDALSQIFGYVMALMSVIGTLYQLHVPAKAQHSAAWVYAGGAIGAVYAGDYATLFLFWELMAFSSVFLVWLRGRRESLGSGYRYLLVHVAGGASLLAGIILQCSGGNWQFSLQSIHTPSLPDYLILLGFLLNAAVPPLHAWLPDAYGESTVGGGVFLCAFTTKTAVYALVRGFAGYDLLVPLGVVMALYGVVYAVLENDSRRLLAYHIISQVGYMVAGVGLGSDMALNGVCAHAFAHILYKGLLFMGCGAVLEMTGQSKFTELGGLYRKMPWTFLFTLIGGLSISAFPLFSGFVSKSMIVAAGFAEHRLVTGYLLMLASVGTFLHTGLKVPYFIWFGKNNCRPSTWERAKEPPWNMIAAMALTSVLCVWIGVWSPWLYAKLPFPTEYHPYTSYHVSETLCLLSFTAVGFFLLLKKLEPHPTVSLDLDWIYRTASRAFLWLCRKPIQAVDTLVGELYRRVGLWALLRSSYWISRFDNSILDGTVDHLAVTVGQLGRRLRAAQRGALQDNLLQALGLGAVIILTLLFLLRP